MTTVDGERGPTDGAVAAALARAGDPTTPLEELAAIAFGTPIARPVIARNPATYEGLLKWLRDLDDPDVNAALRDRERLPVKGPKVADSTDGPDGPIPSTRLKLALSRVPRPVALVAAGSALAILVASVIAIPAITAAQRGLDAANADYADRRIEAVAEAEEAEAELTPAPEPVTPPASTLDASASWSFRNQAGYSYDMTISLGEPVRFEPDSSQTHPRSSDSMYGSACTIDPESDIIIPAEWTATATTQGFDTEVKMSAIISDTGEGYQGSGIAPNREDGRVSIEQYFSDGPNCADFSSTNLWGYAQAGGFGVSFLEPMTTGKTSRHAFIIVVRDYFTPATPDGDTALLDWIVVRPLAGGDKTDGAAVYTDIGPMNMGIYSMSGLTLNGRFVTY